MCQMVNIPMCGEGEGGSSLLSQAEKAVIRWEEAQKVDEGGREASRVIFKITKLFPMFLGLSWMERRGRKERGGGRAREGREKE